jgi:hypothetical protein
MLEGVPVWEPPQLPVSYHRYRNLKCQSRGLRRLLQAALSALKPQVEALLEGARFFSTVEVIPCHERLEWRAAFVWCVVSPSVARFALQREQLEKLLPLLPAHERGSRPTFRLHARRCAQPISAVDPEERLPQQQPLPRAPELDELSFLFEPELVPVLENTLDGCGELTLPYLEPEAFLRRFLEVYEPLARPVQAPMPELRAG